MLRAAASGHGIPGGPREWNANEYPWEILQVFHGRILSPTLRRTARNATAACSSMEIPRSASRMAAGKDGPYLFLAVHSRDRCGMPVPRWRGHCARCQLVFEALSDRAAVQRAEQFA